jgi:hypothetical protein
VRPRSLVPLLAAAAFAVSFAPHASANPYCAGVGPVRGTGPVCTVKCALTLRPSLDPTGVPPVAGTSAPCMWED